MTYRQILWRCMERNIMETAHISSSGYTQEREVAIMNEPDARNWLAQKRKEKQAQEKANASFDYNERISYSIFQHWIDPFAVGPNPADLPKVETTCTCCNGTGKTLQPKYRKEYA